jgi:hypothetical protein
MTVAEELANRNKCRHKLGGVLVAVDGIAAVQAVRSSYWGKDSRLVVVLDGGGELPADRCHLRSKWPVACCAPKRENEWNS